MVEFPMSPAEYTGPKTPFGGPSLEWEFNNISMIAKEETDEEARVGVRGIPTIMEGTLIHLRRILVQEYPRTTANIQRKVLATGLPLVERLVENTPSHRWRMEQAFLEIKSLANTRDFRMKRSSLYVIQLGDKEDGVTSIYAKNKDHTNRIRNISEDLGLPVSDITILCLAAGLAQSVDSTWVPIAIRTSMIEEIKYFSRWLEESK